MKYYYNMYSFLLRDVSLQFIGGGWGSLKNLTFFLFTMQALKLTRKLCFSIVLMEDLQEDILINVECGCDQTSELHELRMLCLLIMLSLEMIWKLWKRVIGTLHLTNAYICDGFRNFNRSLKSRWLFQEKITHNKNAL